MRAAPPACGIAPHTRSSQHDVARSPASRPPWVGGRDGRSVVRRSGESRSRSFLECLHQEASRTMQLCTQRPFGKTSEVRDFLMPVPKDIVEDEDAPGAGWQCGDGPLEIDRLIDVDGAGRWSNRIRNAMILLRAGVAVGAHARGTALLAANPH